MFSTYPRRIGSRPLPFTLIELLVVVAIIAVLASLLLPALSRARVMAHMTKCRSNLRQLGLSYQMYIQDYGDRFFPAEMALLNDAGSISDARKGTWFGMAVHRTLLSDGYMEGRLEFAGATDASKIIRCEGAMRCPSVTDNQLYSVAQSPIGYNSYLGMSAPFWADPTYNWHGQWPIRNHGGIARIHNIENTDKVPIFFDSIYSNRPPRKQWHFGSNYASVQRHPGIYDLNLVFVDGHTDAFGEAQWYREITSF